jgi:hypothetical protein
VGWGEIGLDYHYDNSPRDIQQQVLERQLRQAVRLGKPLTIHTREAEEDTERILKAIVPKDHKVHTIPNLDPFCQANSQLFRYIYIASPTVPSLLSAYSSISPICTSVSLVRDRPQTHVLYALTSIR